MEAAGLLWLGPTAEQIASMGLKHEARARAIAANVPVLPGSELVSTLDAALEQANRVGYPIMLKATGGGGGMGMSICYNEQDLRDNFEPTVGMTKVRARRLLPAALACTLAHEPSPCRPYRPSSRTVVSLSRSSSHAHDTSRCKSSAMGRAR